MINEDNLKHYSPEELVRTQEVIKDMHRLARDHLNVLNEMSEGCMFLLESMGRSNPREWIEVAQDKVYEYHRDIELINEELGRRE